GHTLKRAPSIQTVSWFINLHKNKQLNLSPPYQRHSFWNQDYKNFFIDTVLNDFPSSAIFLYQEIDSKGNTMYHVVDGKQRLETLIDYVNGGFPTPDSVATYAGSYFPDLPIDVKRNVWQYQLSVENVPETKEPYLKDI